MSDSGEIEEDLGFYGDMISPLKSSIDSPPTSSEKHTSNEQRSLSSSPLLETQPLPTDNISICPYCNKNFRKPRVLDCLHSMCEDCVIAQLDGRNDAKRAALKNTDFELEASTPLRPTPPGVIRCPICSQESHVGNDVRFVNFMLLDFVRLRQSIEDDQHKKGERICRACKEEPPAVASCRHCCSDLCKSCVQAHHDMKMFDGHKVVLFSEMPTNSIKDEPPIELALCPLHHSRYEQICSQCDELLCKSCIPEHTTHLCAPITDNIYLVCKSKIIHILNELEAKGQTTAHARSAIPERLAELSTAYERCRDKIDKSFQTFFELLEDIKHQVHADLEKKRDEQEEYYNNLYDKLDLKMAMMHDALNFTNRILEKGTKIELCASRKKIYQQLLILHRSMPDISNEFDIDFETTPLNELRNKFEAIIGTIHCRVTARPSKELKALGGGLISADAEVQLCGDRLNNNNNVYHQQEKIAATASVWNTALNNLNGIIPQLGASSRNSSSHSPTAGVMNGFGGGGTTATASNAPRTNTSPGTIGMERRRGANSQDSTTSNGFASSAIAAAVGFEMFGGELPTSFFQTTTNGNHNSAAHSTSDIFNNMNRLSLDNYNSTTTAAANRGISSTNSFNSLEFSDKIWNPNYPAILNSYGSFGSKAAIDQRFGGGARAGDFEISSFLSRSSQCTTPAFEASAFSVMPGTASGYSSASTRLGSTLEMTLSSMFGANGVECLNTPQGFALGLDDEVAVADTNNHRCVVINSSGKIVRSLGGSGTEEGSFYFPKKIASLARGNDNRYIVLDRGNSQLFSRLQLFRNNGEFICRLIITPYHLEQISVLAVNRENEQLIVIDNKSNLIAFSMETVPQIRPVQAFNFAGYVHEPSDVAVFKGNYYITDYKTHVIVVYSQEGKFLYKFGSTTLTPYPIGIDITKSGDVLVGDSHGNHFHVVVFNSTGQPQQDYKCLAQKVSRCTGLKLMNNGLLVTMSRQHSSVIIFNTLYMSPTI